MTNVRKRYTAGQVNIETASRTLGFNWYNETTLEPLVFRKNIHTQNNNISYGIKRANLNLIDNVHLPMKSITLILGQCFKLEVIYS